MHTKHLLRLIAALRPVHAPCQLIHGDLTPNVLFDARSPAGDHRLLAVLASTSVRGRVISDAPTWEAADEPVLGAVRHVEDFGRFLVRAVIFRAVADRIVRDNAHRAPDDVDPFMLRVGIHPAGWPPQTAD